MDIRFSGTKHQKVHPKIEMHLFLYLFAQNLSHHLIHQDQAAGHMEGTLEGGTLAAIPVQIAGPFNAWRTLLHNGGTLLATTIAAFIPVSWLLALTVVFQLISGLHYFIAKDLRTDS